MRCFALVGFATAVDVARRQAGLRYPLVALIEAMDLESAVRRASGLLAEDGWDNLVVTRSKELDTQADYSGHNLADQIARMRETGAGFAIYSEPVPG